MSHETLAKWIKEQKLRKQDVAQRLNISQGQFSRWVTGAVCPQLSHRMAIERLTDGVVKADGWSK